MTAATATITVKPDTCWIAVKCTAPHCGWAGDLGACIGFVHEGQYPGDEEVDYCCPRCGSDEFEPIMHF